MNATLKAGTTYFTMDDAGNLSAPMTLAADAEVLVVALWDSNETVGYDVFDLDGTPIYVSSDAGR